MLQFLHSHNCTLNEKVIEKAALEGHLHIIIWARKQGCEWNVDACNAAVHSNNLNILRWLRGFDRDTCELESNENEICPWNEHVCLEAIRYGHIDILKFALENGCEFSARCHNAVVESKNINVINCVNDYDKLK